MTVGELTAVAISALGALVGFWNAHKIKRLHLQFNGLEIKYVEAEKKLSFIEGGKQEHDFPT